MSSHIKDQNIIIKNKLYPFLYTTHVKLEKYSLLTLMDVKLYEKYPEYFCNKPNDKFNIESDFSPKILKTVSEKSVSSRSLNLLFESKNDGLKVPYTFKISNKNPLFDLKDKNNDKQNYISTFGRLLYGFSDDLGQMKLYNNK